MERFEVHLTPDFSKHRRVKFHFTFRKYAIRIIAHIEETEIYRCDSSSRISL